jgi:CBS domain-containing protein
MKKDIDTIRVRDAMQPNVVWLLRDQSLRQAADVLSEQDIGGAPVCDREGNVLGMLSKTDLTEYAARDELDRSVERAMTRGATCVGADEPLERAISLMAFEGIHRLVVLDEQAHLAGIITAMDVLREIAGFGRKATMRVIAVAPPE